MTADFEELLRFFPNDPHSRDSQLFYYRLFHPQKIHPRKVRLGQNALLWTSTFEPRPDLRSNRLSYILPTFS